MAAGRTVTAIRDSGGVARNLSVDRDASDADRPVHHSETVAIQATKTRPANTSAFTAGQAIGAAADVVFTFDLKAVGLPLGGLMVGARLIRHATTLTSTRFRGLVHNAVPASLTNADRSDFPLVWANRASRRGWIDFSGPYAGDPASGNDCLDYAGLLSNPQGIVCDPSDGIARIILITRDAIATSVSAEDYLLETHWVL